MWNFIRVKHLWTQAFVVMLAALWLASTAAAQEFRTDPSDDKIRRQHSAKATRWATDSEAYKGEKASFNEYFQKYFFPAMTGGSTNGLAEVGKLRVDLFKKFLWSTSNEELQKDLTAMAFKAMMTILRNQQSPAYHPAVRYNAVLVIGMLDEEYAIDSGANARPPKPLTDATKALTTIVDTAASNKDRFPPPVVLGALIGLERHAKYHQALAPNTVKAMSAALLKLVDHKEPIQGMDPNAYAWLRLRAASALVNLGTLGENNAVHDSLIKLIGDSKSIDDRCSAAALLGDPKLKYEGAKIDAPAATGALFKLASDLSAEELKRALDFEKLEATGGYVQPRGEQFAPNDPDAEQDRFPRRHVLARLVGLRSGLRAVRPAMPADSQQEIDAMMAAIKPVIDAASDKETISLRIADAVRVMSDQITEMVGPADGAADEDEFSASAPAPAAAAPDGAPAAATPPAAGETPPAEAPVAEAAPEAEAPAETQPAEAQPEAAPN